MTDSAAPAPAPAPSPARLRLAYVPGVTPGKWERIWGERYPETPLELRQLPPAEAVRAVAGGESDAGLVRLPVDRDVLHAIPLYTETTVVIVPKDHLVAAADEVVCADLADEIVLHPLDDALGWPEDGLPGKAALERPATTADAVELVAAGIGVLVAPQSLARLHHRRDLTYRTVADAPQSEVALAWLRDATTDEIDDFIGVVRGRTVNSTRGRRGSEADEKAKQKQQPAKKKPAAQQRQGQGRKQGQGQKGKQQGGQKQQPHSGGRPRRPGAGPGRRSRKR